MSFSKTSAPLADNGEDAMVWITVESKVTGKKREFYFPKAQMVTATAETLEDFGEYDYSEFSLDMAKIYRPNKRGVEFDLSLTAVYDEEAQCIVTLTTTD